MKAGRVVDCLPGIGIVVARVFISYAAADPAVAYEVSGWLRTAGHELFLDHDPRGWISLGEDWKRRLYRELHEVDAVMSGLAVRCDPQRLRWLRYFAAVLGAAAPLPAGGVNLRPRVFS